MALITHPSQGQYQTAFLRPQPWSQGSKRRSFVTFQQVDRTTVITSLKHCLYSRPHSINTSQRKPFQILSFKGSEQNVKSDHSDSGSKFTNPLIHPDVHNHHITYSSEDKECSTTGSPLIQKLFRKWLLLLQTQTSGHEDEILNENTAVSEKPEESQKKALKGGAGKLLKSAAANFLKIDAAITLPLLIVIPFYLSVRLMYGSEVTKELTPLWVLGPFIIALYVKIIQALCSLHVFCFVSAITLAKNLPSYYLSVSSYISEGKLKKFMWVRFMKPIVDVKNMNYKHFFARKRKQLQEWAVEKYLDYVESIWPYYCRTIRFLKKANLI